MVVFGATVIVSVSLADDAGDEYDVAMPIDFCRVVVPGSLIAAPGSVVSVFVSVNTTCVSAPGASGPTGLAASTVQPVGTVSATEPAGIAAPPGAVRCRVAVKDCPATLKKRSNVRYSSVPSGSPPGS